CPWESAGTGQPPARGSRSAEVCPWEAQGLGPGDKAEICPWEAAEPPLEDGAPGKASPLPKSLGASKAAGTGSSEREAVCPWESVGAEEPTPSRGTGKEASQK
ncbi:GP179 protein, partial [Alectura lathami]|nr:GP179 protein [Alectura lathami]